MISIRDEPAIATPNSQRPGASAAALIPVWDSSRQRFREVDLRDTDDPLHAVAVAVAQVLAVGRQPAGPGQLTADTLGLAIRAADVVAEDRRIRP